MVRSPLEHAAQTFDVGEWPVGEVAERAFADFAGLAIAPRGAGWRGASSGWGRSRYTWLIIGMSENNSKRIIHNYMATLLVENRQFLFYFNAIKEKTAGSSD